MKRLLFALLLLVPLDFTYAAESESLPERTLKQIVEKQKQLLAEAEKQGEKFDEEAFRTQAQSIAHDYDRLTAGSPTFAVGFASYGYFLGRVGMKKESIAMLLKANQLDPDIPLVKNQIGNYLAEDGKPLEAVRYFLSAIKLAPNEPLYHYQLGTLLTEGRDSFLRSGEWTRAAVDKTMRDAFKRAWELAPDRFDLEYRYALSFEDVENPDWDGALKAWSALEEKAKTPVERQVMRLHAANVLIKAGRLDHAKAVLATVDEPSLQGQKERLLPQLEAMQSAKK